MSDSPWIRQIYVSLDRLERLEATRALSGPLRAEIGARLDELDDMQTALLESGSTCGFHLIARVRGALETKLESLDAARP